MPVDRELAYECLKWIDPRVYRVYLRLRYKGMTPEQVKEDAESFYKLQIVALLNNELDKLEEKGMIEIINDYESEQILVKKNQYNPRSDEHGYSV